MELDLYQKLKIVQLVSRLKAKKEATYKKIIDRAKRNFKKR